MLRFATILITFLTFPLFGVMAQEDDPFKLPFDPIEPPDTVFFDGYYATTFFLHPSAYTGFHRVDNMDSVYRFTFSFADHHNRPTVWSWTYPKYTVDSLNFYYGVNPSLFEATIWSEEQYQRQMQALEKGLFMDDGDYIVPDLFAIVKEQHYITEPIFKLAELHLGEEKNFYSLLDLVMKFCQDMEYRIPPQQEGGKFIGGVYPPSLSLLKGHGDCDSKATLFTSILMHDPDYKIIGLRISGHLYLGVNGVPRPYFKTVMYHGEEYIVCEPVGPARLPIGTRSSLSRGRAIQKKIPLFIDRIKVMEKAKSLDPFKKESE